MTGASVKDTGHPNIRPALEEANQMKRNAVAVLVAVVLAALVTAAPVEIGGALGLKLPSGSSNRVLRR